MHLEETNVDKSAKKVEN